MEKQTYINQIINKAKKLNKADHAFKIIKKLKQAIQILAKLQNKQFQSIVKFTPHKYLIAYYFGTGIQKDYVILKKQMQKYNPQIKLITGIPYGHITFDSQQNAIMLINDCLHIDNLNGINYKNIKFQQGEKMVFYFYTHLKFQELQIQTKLDIQNCQSKFEQNSVPGLYLIQDIITKQQEDLLVKEIDKRKWNRLSNRKVQHYGFQFKYGKNNIDKQQKHLEPIPQFFNTLLQRIYNKQICKHKFDQLTINSYQAGDGIPAHFDTHSPFQETFISISLLSDIVMEFISFRKQFKNILLKSRSMAIFTGEARFAWTHGIANRKMDKVDGKLLYRLRRISLTFRKIKFNPCKCLFYFYCDSQGYNQQTMKKNNPLLKKYLSQQNKVDMSQPQKIEKQFVDKAYNSFGYTFSNPIHPKIIQFIKKIEIGSLVLDIGCGNGYYLNFIQKFKSIGFGIQKCTVMRNLQNPSQQRCFADAIILPYRNQTFDYLLMVAVFHHFASQQKRLKSLCQMLRVLRKNGKGIISIWSFQKMCDIYDSQEIFMDFSLPKHRKKQEQKNIQVQEIQVKSKNQIYKRYYHLFRKQELMDLFKKVMDVQIVSIEQEYDNYYIEFIKK